MPFHEKMLCTVNKIEYDFDKKTGIVWSPEHSVPDMRGSTTTFESIDPDAEEIRHFEGSKVTTVYSKENGAWRRTH